MKDSSKNKNLVSDIPSGVLYAILDAVDHKIGEGKSSADALTLLQESFNSLDGDFCFRIDAENGIPLQRGGHTLAFLMVEGAPPRNVVQVLKREACHLLERDLRERRKAAELAKLNRASSMVSSSMGLGSTLKAILLMALEVTSARYGILRLLDESSGQLVTAEVVGDMLDRPLIEALPLDGPYVTCWVASRRRSLRIDDIPNSPWADYYLPLDEDLDMRSELAVPLLGNNGRLDGVLNLESPELNAFSAEDQLLLESFASQAVLAIQQARLLDALQEIAECLLEWPCEKVLERLVESAALLVNANGIELHHAKGCLKVGRPSGTKQLVELENLGTLSAYMDSAGEWEHKVLACLAHHAVLALKNERRLQQLKMSQQRQALTETFAAVGDLSANLLHQFNNKIGAIPVRVEGILEKCSDLVENSSYLHNSLRRIENSAQEALQIVHQNLTLLKPRPTGLVDLASCVHRAAKELDATALVVSRLRDLQVQGDARSLTLVFLNLFENAQRVIGPQGRITVSGEKTEDMICVHVVDNGPGIPFHRQSSIFEFSSDRSRPHNLGFGLWWVRTVMERMGGSIGVRSDRINGTDFCLEFPLS